MHRSHPFTTPHVASRLPPFGPVGWLTTIFSESDHQRHGRSGPGEVFDLPPLVGIEPARRDGQAWQWKHPFAPAPDWLRRVLHLRIRRA